MPKKKEKKKNSKKPTLKIPLLFFLMSCLPFLLIFAQAPNNQVSVSPSAFDIYIHILTYRNDGENAHTDNSTSNPKHCRHPPTHMHISIQSCIWCLWRVATSSYETSASQQRHQDADIIDEWKKKKKWARLIIKLYMPFSLISQLVYCFYECH